mmetsp:Transcript_20420/g.52215  ORF Transcript_20420/g.52215 Transcript_20420/m.52215 type:complete len:347 (+) Transcript_20420:303-1343(+)
MSTLKMAEHRESTSQPLAVALLAKLYLRLAIVRRGVFRGLRTTAGWLPLLLLLLCLKSLLLLVLRLPATPAGLGSARRRALLGRRHGPAAGLEKIKDLGHELRAEGRRSVSAALHLVVATVHAQLLHGRHKLAHRLHRSDVVLLAGHDHDRELQHPPHLLEHGIPGEQHRWGEWHEGRPQLGVRCAQMEGASAAHRMPHEVDPLRVHVEVPAHNCEDIQNIALAQLPRMLGRGIGIPPAQAAIPTTVAVAERSNDDVAPLLGLPREASVADHLVWVAEESVQQDDHGCRGLPSITCRHEDRILHRSPRLLEVVGSPLDGPVTARHPLRRGGHFALSERGVTQGGCV